MTNWDVQWLSGSLTLPLWAAGATAAAFVFVLVLAVSRPGLAQRSRTLGRNALILLGLLAAWSVFDRLVLKERVGGGEPRVEQQAATDRQQLPAAERQALEARARDLTARSLAPGSALACLPGVAGETVEAACEKAVFASAEAAAAAVAYTAEQLSLIADSLDYARRVDPSFAVKLEPWRRALEADRYGLVAQVLMNRDGCTAEKCDQLALFGDPAVVQSNLRARTFDGLVAQYSEAWRTRPGEPGPAVAAAAAAPGTLPVVRNIDFPSAASIPAISIMNPEPAAAPGHTTGSADPGAASGSGPTASAKRPTGTEAAASTKRPAAKNDHARELPKRTRPGESHPEASTRSAPPASAVAGEAPGQ